MAKETIVHFIRLIQPYRNILLCGTIIGYVRPKPYKETQVKSKVTCKKCLKKLAKLNKK